MNDKIFALVLFIPFSLLLFYLLFIAEAFPGFGWFSFSVKEVSIKLRVVSFILYGIGAVSKMTDAYPLIGIISIISAFCILIFCRD